MAVVLFAISPLLAPGSLSSSSLDSMLPFAAVLVIASLGQTLVITQGGIDLSVPGAMALAAVFVTKIPEQTGMPLWLAVLLGLGAGLLGGLVIGLVVVRFGIAAFVASLAMNSILIGVVLHVSDGFPGSADASFSDFAVGSFLGVQNLVIIAVLCVLLLGLARSRTVVGRRFMAVGASAPAAHLLGIRSKAHQVGAYAVAGLFYALAGLLLAGYLRTPDILLGNPYQLSTIAAVVLGGSLLTGGVSSAAATAVAALFLTQLNQVVLAAGAATSMQLLVQAIVLALAVVLTRMPIKRLLRRRTS
ncbi:ABC transporter permease [Aeromicrobium sp. UC242_57]|uniref:ABC transporter permease n=1 Tax=Aeromicrobium sp. UC242_57 TaxID=3374624 RepID=UPI0037B6D454